MFVFAKTLFQKSDHQLKQTNRSSFGICLDVCFGVWGRNLICTCFGVVEHGGDFFQDVGNGLGLINKRYSFSEGL